MSDLLALKANRQKGRKLKVESPPSVRQGSAFVLLLFLRVPLFEGGRSKAAFLLSKIPAQGRIIGVLRLRITGAIAFIYFPHKGKHILVEGFTLCCLLKDSLSGSLREPFSPDPPLSGAGVIEGVGLISQLSFFIDS